MKAILLLKRILSCHVCWECEQLVTLYHIFQPPNPTKKTIYIVKLIYTHTCTYIYYDLECMYLCIKGDYSKLL